MHFIVLDETVEASPLKARRMSSRELLPVARRRGCGMPNGGQVSSEREQTTALILGERRWTRLFAA